MYGFWLRNLGRWHCVECRTDALAQGGRRCHQWRGGESSTDRIVDVELATAAFAPDEVRVDLRDRLRRKLAVGVGAEELTQYLMARLANRLLSGIGV